MRIYTEKRLFTDEKTWAGSFVVRSWCYQYQPEGRSWKFRIRCERGVGFSTFWTGQSLADVYATWGRDSEPSLIFQQMLTKSEFAKLKAQEDRT